MTPEDLVSILTVRSIGYQQQYLAEEGRAPWTDEQIARLYGQSALEAWKKHKAKQIIPANTDIKVPHEAREAMNDNSWQGGSAA